MSALASHSGQAHSTSSKSGGSRALATPRSMSGPHNPWIIGVVVSIATFMEVLDTAIANVSLQHIAGSLSVGPDESTWVLTSYLVANAVVLPISGWLANIVGRKQFYMSCVAIFTASSIACGFAPSLGWLIFFRVLQGAGGGGLAPSEQSILADTFTPKQRGLAFAMYGIAVVFAPAVGPTLGGWITDNYSWHWIFLINGPVGIASLLLSYIFLVEPPKEKKERKARVKKGISVDYIGFGLVAVGLGCLQVVLDKGERDDWFESRFIITMSVISVVSIISLIVWELNHKHPIVDLRLFGRRSFAASSMLMFAMGFILFGTTQLLPQLTQSLFGYTATDAGLVITPGGIVVMALMPIVGILIGKVQPRYLILIGMLIEVGALWHLSTLSLDASYGQLAMARIYQAMGLAFLFVPITTASYAGIPGEKSNEASAMINLMRNLGGGFGISLAQTWIAQKAQVHQTYLVDHLATSDRTYQAALGHMTQMLHGGGGAAGGGGSGGLPTIPRQAYGMLSSAVQRQASILAYLDTFRMMCYCALAATGFVFLLKKVKPGQANAH